LCARQGARTWRWKSSTRSARGSVPKKGSARPQTQNPAAVTLQAKLRQGLALHQQGNLADAERIYGEVLRQQSNHFDALHLLGVIALQTRRTERAVELITKAIGLDEKVATAHSNLGSALHDLKRPAEALASYDKAIALKPDYAEAHYNRGNALSGLKRSEDALATYDRAIALKPDYAEAHSNRSVTLQDLKRPADALASCDRAIALKPDYAEAYYNRGNALSDLKRPEEALASWDKAIALKPDYAEAYYNRGSAFARLRRHDKAFAAYDKALALNSDLIGAESARLHSKMHICDWSNFDADCAHLISSVRNENVNIPFQLLAIPSSSGDQLQCAKRWIANKYPPSEKSIWQGNRYDHSRIRIAYLSADFYQHATSYLMAGMFECHDNSRFDVTAISIEADDNSELRQRLKAAFEHFIDARNYTDVQIADLVRGLEIDILIDLKGFTADSRTGILARRSAPIQVNYLGYPGTMGAPYIDYIVADQIVIPKTQWGFYSEKVVFLPNSYQVNDTKRSIADKALTRAELALPPTGFVFCCFNNNYKITPRIFDCWMRILKQVEGSVLWLLEDNANAASNLRKEAAARDVSTERLIFAKRMPLPEHLARHRLADLFLDTLPCNAHTSASDALWAGLPVLTSLGETFAGKVAASLLNAIRLPELITTTLEAYERMAIDLVMHPERLAIIKRKLAENRLTTPLFDTKLFTRHIEAAYRTMYERHQAGLAPDHIDVPDA